MTELEQNMDFIRSCSWAFIREMHLNPWPYYRDIEQEAIVAWIAWRRKLDEKDCPANWRKYARSAIRYHLYRHFSKLTGYCPTWIAPYRVSVRGHIENPAETTQEDMDCVYIKDWMSTLAPDERKIVKMLISGVPSASVAEKVNMTHGTYYRKRRRIRDSYRSYFGDAG